MFADVPVWKKMLITVFLALLALFFSSAVMYVLAIVADVQYSFSTSLHWVRAMQLVQAAFTFIAVPTVCAYLFTYKFKTFYLFSIPSKKESVLVLLAMLFLLPLINLTAELNEAIPFSGSLYEWMSSLEESAERTLQLLLSDTSIQGLFISLFIMAVIPAVGEELLFRGLLQKLLADWSRNSHVAIWITAFIFSFIHFQFMGFFPRMLLGVFFGYLYAWKNNLLLPMLAHFANNAIAVFAYWTINRYSLSIDIDGVGTYETLYLSILSAPLFASLVWLLYKKNRA